MAAKHRIGFVDNDLNNFHANVFLKDARDTLKDRGFEIAGCTALQAAEGKEWASANDVQWFDSVDEMDASVDHYMILAPGDPHLHLQLAQDVLPKGKPTYIDKTFAPDLATAEKIFALADEHGSPVQSTSVLRYTDVQKYLDEVGGDNVRHMIAWGGGRSFGEYAIHPLEMLVSCMGTEVTALMRRGDEQCSQLLVELSGGRTAVVNVYIACGTPFAATVTSTEATKHIEVDSGRLFVDGLAAVMDFLESGKPNIDRAETLKIHRLIDIANSPESREGFVQI